MEHEVLAETGGVRRQRRGRGRRRRRGGTAACADRRARRRAIAPTLRERRPRPPSDGLRADLEAVRERHAVGLDAARPEAVARRRKRGRRTARENLAELVDEGTYVEYGPLLFAAQETRRTREELIARTPADGLVAGVGEIDGRPCVAMSYDYTVLAGTQGMRNHAKKDRLFEIAERRRLPVVLFAEGGGGRPGDVDMPIVAGLDCRAFRAVRAPQRPGAAGRHRLGLLLRRQRRAARLLRRGDRQRGREHRHGRPGDDRGRRPRRLRARRGRADRRAGRQRRGRPARRRRPRGGRGRQALPLLLPRTARARPAGRPGAAAGS